MSEVQRGSDGEGMNKHPIKVEELPNDSFYAILYPESVTIPGDERSRTNPGHGYPEHTVHHWRMEVFHDRETWVNEIKRLESATGYMRRSFKAIHATPAKVTTEVHVKVDVQ